MLGVEAVEGWTTDSNDSAWAPDFNDFASNNSSDNDNSDWFLLDNEDVAEVEDQAFDVEQYREYTYVDPIRGAIVERIRHLYRDSK